MITCQGYNKIKKNGNKPVVFQQFLELNFCFTMFWRNRWHPIKLFFFMFQSLHLVPLSTKKKRWLYLKTILKCHIQIERDFYSTGSFSALLWQNYLEAEKEKKMFLSKFLPLSILNVQCTILQSRDTYWFKEKIGV